MTLLNQLYSTTVLMGCVWMCKVPHCNVADVLVVMLNVCMQPWQTRLCTLHTRNRIPRHCLCVKSYYCTLPDLCAL